MMRRQAALALALLLAGAAPASAQSTHMNMPEGSKDVSIALVTYYGPRHLGSADKRMGMLPMFSAQWANGVFVQMNRVGMHLSDRGDMRFGPVVSPTFSRSSEPAPGGTKPKHRFTPQVGGFFRYNVAHGLSLNSEVMYGGSSDRRGVHWDAGASFGLPVAEHHAIGLDVDVRLANRSALQADYAVLPWQSAVSGLPLYQARSGVESTSLTASWRWELNHKYTLRTVLQRSQLHGGAAASPRMERSSGVSVVTILSYEF